MRQTAVLILALVLAGSSACSGRNLFGERYSNSNAVRHTVRERGETLSSISRRYTGSSQRWRQILAANPGVDTRQLRVGQEIWVPRELVRRTPQPRRERGQPTTVASAIAARRISVAEAVDPTPKTGYESETATERAIRDEVLRERLLDAVLSKDCSAEGSAEDRAANQAEGSSE